MTRRVARRSPARGGGRAHRRVELVQWRRSIGPSRPRRVVRRCPGHQPAGDRCGRRGLGRTLSCGPRSRRGRGRPRRFSDPLRFSTDGGETWTASDLPDVAWIDRALSADSISLVRPAAMDGTVLAVGGPRGLVAFEARTPPILWVSMDGDRSFSAPSSVGEGVTSGRRTPTRRSIREGTPFSCGSRRSRVQTFVGAGADARSVVGGMIRSSSRRGGTSEGDEVRHG